VITVHMIGQAHLDPVWLWPWQAGMDEALATCRSACSLLDEFPEFVFSMGEAWRYQQVERLAPALFTRIQQHVKAGRWEIVGGWLIQPDCNLPSDFAFQKQISLGKEYFLDRFGFFPEVAYNVDSFGHSAALPGLIAAAGQKYYVVGRPQEAAMPMESHLFRWRGYAEGPEVTAFRIADGYLSVKAPTESHIRAAAEKLPPGITHTMCFYGIGDHGGGPYADMIRWIRDHEHALEDCRLVFSSPSRFFRAIAGQSTQLPVVTGELYYFAIGAYSVQRQIKTGVRRAEHLLRQAEIAQAEGGPEVKAQLEDAWQAVCFNHFHDILGGTSLASASVTAARQLSYAWTIADRLAQYGLRDNLNGLPDDPLQRVVFFNASDEAFDGYVEFEPYVPWNRLKKHIRTLDEANRPIPLQRLLTEAASPDSCHLARLLIRMHLDAGQMGTVKIDPDTPCADAPCRVRGGIDAIATEAGVSLSLGDTPGITFASGDRLLLPRIDMIEDLTDNWTAHGDRYPEGPVVSASWNAPCSLYDGPLMAALLHTGTVGCSALRAEWRVYADEPFVELHLVVHWHEVRKILKLTVALPGGAAPHRLDGVMGTSLRRQNDGSERVLRDWTLVETRSARLGIVSPDTYALDGTARRLRLTLLRSPIQTSGPSAAAGMVLNGTPADQGVHEFRFRFFLGDVAEELLEAQARMLHRPLLTAELTRGMARRYEYEGAI
jgi:alpha-mannosidase